MRPELTHVLSLPNPIIVVSGDTGTGKSSILGAHQTHRAAGGVIAPPPTTCSWDGGALQVAILEGLVSALSTSILDRTLWRKVQHRFDMASKQMAAELGKSFAKAVTQELLALVKGRLGEHVGEGAAAFIKGLRRDTTEEMRRDLQTRSDSNVVKLLVRLCDEVASVLKRDLILAIDECQRLTDDDQRTLASLVLAPPKRAQLVLGWSSAAHHPQVGLARLREAGCGEAVVDGLNHAGVRSMLTRAGLSTTHTDRVHFLSNGFPLIIEGLIGQLRSGGSLDEYTPPTAFVLSLEHALARLPADAQVAARQLAVYELPPNERTIASYLDLTATQWGVLRTALERESILSIDRNGQMWFHESRRGHLWNSMLSDTEREEIGEPAYRALLDEYRRDSIEFSGLMVPIARTAAFALTSQVDNPALTTILRLNSAELAVLAALIELETTHPGGVWTPPEPALIYAHNRFGADRGEALTAIPVLLEQGLITTADEDTQINPDPHVVVTLDADPDDQTRIVLHGRIQDVLGKSMVPQITNRVVHEHYEQLRVESTLVLTDPGRTDASELLDRANEHQFYRFNMLTGSVYPVLAVWVDYGGQPISMSSIFNTTVNRRDAKASALTVDTVAYGRRVKTARVFEDQASSIPSHRLFQAVHLATGRPVASDGAEKWWMKNPGPALPMREYAYRRAALVDILRNNVSDVEREIYALTEPRGYAVGQSRDETYFFVELRGTSRVIELTESQLGILQDDSPFRFARLEHHLALRPGERTHHINERVQAAGLIDDPVVDLLEDFWNTARRFNRLQPPQKIKMKAGALTQLLRSSHIRTAALARTLSEQLTIGGERGHRPQHALRVAVHLGNAEVPSLVAYSQPIGDPTDVQIKFAQRTSNPGDAAGLYSELYGDDEAVDVYGDEAQPAIATLLGFNSDEIELIA